MKKWIEHIYKIAEREGWTIHTSKNYVGLQIYSIYNHDFNIELNCKSEEDFYHQLREFIDGYDVCYETYIWLGSDGHGINGAPDDMKTIYEDMEWCLLKTEELYDGLIS